MTAPILSPDPLCPYLNTDLQVDSNYRAAKQWSRDRVADCDTLERCCTSNRTVSSNLTDSANIMQCRRTIRWWKLVYTLGAKPGFARAFAGSNPVHLHCINFLIARSPCALLFIQCRGMENKAGGQFYAEHTGMAPVESVILQRVILTASTGFESSLGSRSTGYSAAW